MGVLIFACVVMFLGALATGSSKVPSRGSLAVGLLGMGVGGGVVILAFACVAKVVAYNPHDDGWINLSGAFGFIIAVALGSWIVPWMGAIRLVRNLLQRSLSTGSRVSTGVGGFILAVGATLLLVKNFDNPPGPYVKVVLNGLTLTCADAILLLLMARTGSPEDTVKPAPGQQSSEVLARARAVGPPAPAVLQQVKRLGGVYRPPSPEGPRAQADSRLPEPIRSFLYDIQWSEARFQGGPLLPGVFMLGFSPVSVPRRSEFCAAIACGGISQLIIRLDSPDPSDPFVFIREKDGQEGEQLPLSTLLAQLAPEGPLRPDGPST